MTRPASDVAREWLDKYVYGAYRSKADTYSALAALLERERLEARFNGIVEGVWRFGWWKDGMCMVGTCGKTFAEAKTQIDDERDAALDAASKGEK